MKQLVLIMCLLAGIGKTIAQCDIDVYKELIAAGDQFVAQKKYKEALNKYNAARLFCENKTKETDVYIARLYDQINQEKINAENNYRKAHLFSQYIDFKNNRSAWIYSDGYFAVIDSNGNLKTGFIFERPQPFKNNVAIAMLNGKFVFVNEKGKIISDRYEYIIPVCCGNYFARNAGDDNQGVNYMQQSILNEHGKIIADFTNLVIEHVNWLSPNISIKHPYSETDNSNYFTEMGFIDSTGKIVIQPRFKSLKYIPPYFYFASYNQNEIKAMEDGISFYRSNLGIMTADGKVLLSDSISEYVSEVEDNYYFLQKDSFWYNYSINGNYKKLDFKDLFLIGERSWDERHPFHGPYARVAVEKKTRKIIPARYPAPKINIEDKTSDVKKTEKKKSKKPKEKSTSNQALEVIDEIWQEYPKLVYKLINNKGEDIGENLWYDSIIYDQTDDSFDNNWLWVEKDSLFGIISITGKAITPIQYNAIAKRYRNLVPFAEKSIWGIMNTKGQIIIKPQYDSIHLLNYFYMAFKGRDTFLINGSGDAIKNVYQNQPIINLIEYADAPHISIIITKQMKYGLVLNNKIIVNPEYNLGNYIGNGIIVLHKDGKNFFYNKECKLIHVSAYDFVGYFDNGISRVNTQMKVGYVKYISSDSIQELIPAEYDLIFPPQHGIIVATKNSSTLYTNNTEGETTCFNLNGEKVVSPFIGIVEKITKDNLVLNTRGQSFIVNKKGESENISHTPFSDFLQADYRMVYSPLGWNYIRKDGSQVCKSPFEKGTIMKNGYAYIIRQGQGCIIDSAGNENCDSNFNYSYLTGINFNGFFQNHLLVRDSDTEWGYLTTAGKFIKYDSFTIFNSFSENIAMFQWKEGGDGAILNLNGEKKYIPYEFIYSDLFHNGFSRVLFNSYSLGNGFMNSWGFISADGKKLDGTFDDALNFSEGIAAVKANNKWYYINSQGKQAFPGEFEYASSFKNNIAFVRHIGSNHLTFINKKGEILFPSYHITEVDFGQFENQNNNSSFIGEVYTCPENPISAGTPLLVVKNDSNFWGLMNLKGEMIIPFKYDKIWPEKTDVWLLEKDGRFGLYDITNHIKLLNPVYSEFGKEMRNTGYIRVKKNGYWGWVNPKGEVIIPFKYKYALPMINGKAWVLQEPYPNYFQINAKGEMILNSVKSEFNLNEQTK